MKLFCIQQYFGSMCYSSIDCNKHSLLMKFIFLCVSVTPASRSGNTRTDRGSETYDT